MGTLGDQTQRTIGRYVLHDEIAAGGMATVHLARLHGSAGFSRIVALKRLHPQFAKDPEFLAMFLDEARLAARVRHPNVVPTVDVVGEEGELFLVMDYVPGESLRSLLRAAISQMQPTPPAVAAAVVAGVLHGLHAAHEATGASGEPLHIVHRDVSPHNILVGKDGVPRLLDFGIAKASGRTQITQEGTVKGKVGYMSPEYLFEGVANRQTDVYAVAVVLWEALTQRRLVEGDNGFIQAARVTMLRPRPPSEIVPGLPPSLDAVVLRGLARDPKDRFASALEMATALEAAGRMAAPAEVAAWVEVTAGESLAARARRVAAIENPDTAHRGIASVVPVDSTVDALKTDPFADAPTIKREVDSPPPPRPADDAEEPSRVAPTESTAVMVAVREPARAPRRRSRWAVLAVSACAVVMVVVAVRHVHGTASPARAAPPRNETAALYVAPPDPVPIALPPVSAPTREAAATVTAPAAAAPSLRKPRRHASSPARSAPTGATSVVAAPPDCDPPYTLDPSGVQHPKRECLQGR